MTKKTVHPSAAIKMNMFVADSHVVTGYNPRCHRGEHTNRSEANFRGWAPYLLLSYWRGCLPRYRRGERERERERERKREREWYLRPSSSVGEPMTTKLRAVPAAVAQSTNFADCSFDDTTSSCWGCSCMLDMTYSVATLSSVSVYFPSTNLHRALKMIIVPMVVFR